jgi:hypothetical protein
MASKQNPLPKGTPKNSITAGGKEYPVIYLMAKNTPIKTIQPTTTPNKKLRIIFISTLTNTLIPSISGFFFSISHRPFSPTLLAFAVIPTATSVVAGSIIKGYSSPTAAKRA